MQIQFGAQAQYTVSPLTVCAKKLNDTGKVILKDIADSCDGIPELGVNIVTLVVY